MVKYLEEITMFDRVERSLIIGRAIQASQQLRLKKDDLGAGCC